MNKIKSLKEYYELIENNDKVIIYWYTRWCPDCFAMKIVLPKLEKDFVDYKFFSVNRDMDIELSKHLNIFGIPSFLIYYKGDEIDRFVDKRRKSYIQVKDFITKAIK
ncbi:MAG: Thioredoxin-like protein YtpP [Candidatus Izimaplasma bacterium HR2]|nr:MAG: Thioredoxin-like protein YtpP [Candidatus Izimaplasma bacterium HR2]